MPTDPIEDVRKDLAALRRRMALGELDEEIYQRQRQLILEDLTPDEQRQLGTATPQPVASSARLGPSGAVGEGLRTALPSLADLELEPGTVLFQQWRIESELGRGGFGVVFEAYEFLLDQKQAIKVLDPAMVGRAELLARFRREVALMRQLIHPRVVRVYDYREDLELSQALISMELVPGGSVKDLVAAAREGGEPVPLPLILKILSQVLEALAAAHAQDVIHRDVTPGNILLAGGSPAELLADPDHDPEVKLVDFGIAALVERSELSQKSRVLGTAAYVAPEILDPSAGDQGPSADVYGSGAVVYELLTGEPPLGRFEEPSTLRPGLPVQVDRLILSMLERRPGKRPFASQALEQCRGLEGSYKGQEAKQWQAGAAVVTTPADVAVPRGTPEESESPPVARRRSNPVLWIGALVTIVLLSLVFWPKAEVPTAILEAQPASIELGDATTLSWTTTGADEVLLEPGLGSVEAQGSRQVLPEEETNYQLVARGAGQEAKAAVVVQVTLPPPRPTASLEAKPQAIGWGQSTTLTWTTTDATEVHLEPDMGSVKPRGAVELSPKKDTTYKLTVQGSGGTAADNVTVKVFQPPRATPPPPPRATPPPPAAPPEERYVIQVLSTRDEARANRVIDRLLKGGYPAFPSPVTVGTQVQYRVRIGPYETRPPAEKAAREINSKYKLDTWITAASN